MLQTNQKLSSPDRSPLSVWSFPLWRSAQMEKRRNSFHIATPCSLGKQKWRGPLRRLSLADRDMSYFFSGFWRITSAETRGPWWSRQSRRLQTTTRKLSPRCATLTVPNALSIMRLWTRWERAHRPPIQRVLDNRPNLSPSSLNDISTGFLMAIVIDGVKGLRFFRGGSDFLPKLHSLFRQDIVRNRMRISCLPLKPLFEEDWNS